MRRGDLGCVHALHCHTGKCPAGIATSDKNKQKALHVEAASERVATYATTLIKESQMLAESCGYSDPTQIRSTDVMMQVEPGRFEYLSDLSLIGRRG